MLLEYKETLLNTGTSLGNELFAVSTISRDHHVKEDSSPVHISVLQQQIPPIQ